MGAGPGRVRLLGKEIIGMRIYLSGGITGVKDYFATFAKYADQLRGEDHLVFNPTAANLEHLAIEDIFAIELDWLCKHAEAIAMIPGWENSKGAVAEHAVAVAIGKVIIFL
jgi:hypothetical protein